MAAADGTASGRSGIFAGDGVAVGGVGGFAFDDGLTTLPSPRFLIGGGWDGFTGLICGIYIDLENLLLLVNFELTVWWIKSLLGGSGVHDAKKTV